jgi:DNA-nicking Smr family endonuclease
LTNNISEKDKKDWINFINSKEKIHNKDEKFYKKPNIKTKILDLHGYTLDDANKTIENFINKAFSENINKLVIITGKGLHSNNEKDPYVSKNLGILKYSVPEYISKNESLMSMINEIVDANIEDGGSGAFYIYLKKNKNI